MKLDKPAFAGAGLLLSFGLAFGPCATVMAGESADPGYSTVSPIEVFARKDINLNKDTGTGSRLELTVLEIPASIEVLSGDTIRERGDLSISEAISRVTGVTAMGTPGDGGGAVSARGFTGLGSVMQIYDGMRLFVAAGTITFPFDPWTADRIEVLRGPASVMFGEGAIGGAINVVPKQATPDARSGEYQLGYGTFNTARAAVGVGGPWSPAVSYRLDASYNRSDNWVERGDSDSLAVSGSLRWQAAPSLVVTLRDDYGDQHPTQYFGTPLINHKILSGTETINYDILDSILHYRDNWTQLKAEWTPSDAVTVRNDLYRLTSHRQWRNAEVYIWDPASNLIDRTDNFIAIKHDQVQVGDRVEVTLKSEIGGLKNRLAVGAEYNDIDFTHTNNGFADRGLPGNKVTIFHPNVGTFANLSYPIVPAYHTDSTQYAVFGEDRIELTPQLSLIGGLRWDHFQFHRTTFSNGAQFGKTYSYSDWRVGAVYAPTGALSFYSQYGTGSDPLGALVTTSSGTIAKNYKLSVGKQAEVGVKQIFRDGRGQWTLAAYDITKKNLLTTLPGQPNVIQQVGERSSKGVEATLAFSPAAGWTVEANAALLRARYEKFFENDGSPTGASRAGKTPPNVAEKTANLWVSYQFQPDWQARAGLRYVGQLFNDNANTLVVPAYTVVDASIDWAIRPETKVTLRVSNLFDETYAQATYADEQWILGRPRAVEISVHGRF